MNVKIIEKFYTEELEAEIEQLITQGWVLSGGITSVLCNTDRDPNNHNTFYHNNQYIAVMVRKD